MGISLRQADGFNELATSGGGRGDNGDPFPGLSGNQNFHAGSNPASTSHTGGAAGLTVMGIAKLGTDMGFRLLTRFQNISLRTAGTSSGDGLFTVDGVRLAPAP